MTTRRTFKSVAAGFAALMLLAFGALLLIGPERLWARFGPPDLGAVDFATLQRRDTPNDALACLPDFCAAAADMPALVTTRSAADVFPSVQEAVAGEPGVEQVAADAEAGTLRYVARSRLLKFPDTINVQVVATNEGGAAVLLYSRSQIGRGDMGVNRARLERWTALIKARLEQP